MNNMIVRLRELTYHIKTEELIGLVHVKYDDVDAEASCLFTATESDIKFDPAGISLPNWTFTQKSEVERRIGLLLKKFQKDPVYMGQVITFVV